MTTSKTTATLTAKVMVRERINPLFFYKLFIDIIVIELLIGYVIETV